MAYLILGLIVFFGIHVVRMVAPGFRAARIEALGEGPWKGIYSVVALVGLVLIVWGWMQYRAEAPQVYVPPEWGRHVTALLVLIAFILLGAGNGPVGRIRATLVHPFLIGIMLWAAGHLFANGDLASVLLFGAFLVYAIVNRIAVGFRSEPAPVFATYRGDIIAIVSGIVLYLVFVLWLHGLLFGVVPLG